QAVTSRRCKSTSVSAVAIRRVAGLVIGGASGGGGSGTMRGPALPASRRFAGRVRCSSSGGGELTAMLLAISAKSRRGLVREDEGTRPAVGPQRGGAVPSADGAGLPGASDAASEGRSVAPPLPTPSRRRSQLFRAPPTSAFVSW